jgi:hypothetical protein
MISRAITDGLRNMAENILVGQDADILITAAMLIELYEERLAEFERALRDISSLCVPPKRVGFLQDIARRALTLEPNKSKS